MCMWLLLLVVLVSQLSGNLVSLERIVILFDAAAVAAAAAVLFFVTCFC